MISPAPLDFYATARQSLPLKSAFPDECDRSRVVRLNNGLKPMKFEFGERVSNHQPHPFIHQSLPCVRQERIITEGRALMGTKNHIVQVDDANDFTRFAKHDKKSVMRSGGKPLDISQELARGLRLRQNPMFMQGTTATHGIQKCRTVAGNRRPDSHTRR